VCTWISPGPEALLLENLVGEIDLLEPERHVTVARERATRKRWRATT
jgi:hypothetical protein